MLEPPLGCRHTSHAVKALPNLSRTASKNRVNKAAVSAMSARSGPAEALSPVPDSPAIFNYRNPTLWDLSLSSIFSRWTEPPAPGRVPPWQPRPFSPRQHQPRSRRQTLCAALFRTFWNAYPCPCPPCPLAFDELSYLIIHNITRHPMLINIRNTGTNRFAWLTAAPYAAPNPVRGSVQDFLERLSLSLPSLSPCLSRSLTPHNS